MKDVADDLERNIRELMSRDPNAAAILMALFRSNPRVQRLVAAEIRRFLKCTTPNLTK